MATTYERTVIEIRGMTITITSDDALFVEIGDRTFNIDDSTGEAICDWWMTATSCPECERALPVEATRCRHCNATDYQEE